MGFYLKSSFTGWNFIKRPHLIHSSGSNDQPNRATKLNHQPHTLFDGIWRAFQIYTLILFILGFCWATLASTAGQAQNMKDYYQVLGVLQTADQNTIKKSFKALAFKYHPDRNPNDPGAEDQFKIISEAYSILSNPESRKKYDRHQEVSHDPFKYTQQTSDEYKQDLTGNFTEKHGIRWELDPYFPELSIRDFDILFISNGKIVYISGPLQRQTHWSPDKIERIIGEEFKQERPPPSLDENLAGLLGQLLDPSFVTQPPDRIGIERLESLMALGANEKMWRDCELWAIWYLSSLEVKNSGGRYYRNVQKIDRLFSLSFTSQLPGLVDLLLSKTNVWKLFVNHFSDPKWRTHNEAEKWVRSIIEKGEGSVLENLIEKYFEGGSPPSSDTIFTNEMPPLLEELIKKHPANGETGPHNFQMASIRLQKFFNNEWVMRKFKQEFFTFIQYRGSVLKHLNEYIQKVPILTRAERLDLMNEKSPHFDSDHFGIHPCEFILKAGKK